MTVNDHPDLEALSAYHDGEAPEWRDHVASCPSCQGRLEELGAVTAAIRSPVGPPSAASIDAAIGRAMTEADPAHRSPGPPPANEVAARRGRARAMAWTVAASVAALVVAVVGSVSVLRGGDDGGGTTTADRALTEEAPPAPEPDARTGPDSPALTGPLGPGAATSQDAAGGTDFDGAVIGGELGAVDGAGSLVARVEPALKAAGVVGGTAEAGEDSAASSPADQRAGRRVVGTRPCELEARESDRGVDDVVYVATASWQGTPVVVLGFSRQESAPGITLMVLARDGCVLVSSTPL